MGDPHKANEGDSSRLACWKIEDSTFICSESQLWISLLLIHVPLNMIHNIRSILIDNRFFYLISSEKKIKAACLDPRWWRASPAYDMIPQHQDKGIYVQISSSDCKVFKRISANGGALINRVNKIKKISINKKKPFYLLKDHL